MRKTLLCSFMLLMAYLPAISQISIPASGTVTEKFNAMASGTALPSHWKVSAAGTIANWTSAANVTSVSQVSSSGSPNTAGSYNWGTAAGTDRAVGFMTDAGYGSPNAIMAYYQNNTGSTITELTVTFQVERYRSNTAPFYLQFFSSGDGSNWTIQASGSMSAAVFTPAGSSYTFATPLTVYKTVTVSGVTIPNGSAIYLRWVFGSSGTSGQGMGLDNVSVSVNTALPSVSATLTDALSTDVNINTKANEGDGLTYTATITSKGKDATGVQYTAPLDANTALVNASLKSSPVAVDDNFTTALNTATSGNVKANDFGLPTAAFQVLSFGSTETPSATTAGTGGKSDNGGDVTVNADGSFSYTPPSSSFTGYDRFAYTLAAGVTPNDVGIVTIAVGSAPSATAESFSVLGNVSIQPNAASGVLINDGGSGIGIGAVNDNPAGVGTPITTTHGGTVTLQPDGSFTYNPAPGFTGASDNFSYTVDNGFSSPVTVQATLNISGLIWFINNTAGSGGDGRLSSPYNSLAGVTNGAGGSATNQTIFLYSGSGSYTDGITLLSGQKLIGQGATTDLATFAGVTVPAHSATLPSTGGTAPVITNSAGNGVTLASGNTLRGFTLGNATGNALSGTSIGTLTVSELSINTTGQAINLSDGTLAGSFTGITSSGGFNNIRISSVGSSSAIDLGGGALSGATDDAFFVSGGNLSLTYSGNITHTNTGPGDVGLMQIQGGHTGTLTFNTGTLSATGWTGLYFANADGTYHFNGTTTLNGVGNGISLQNGSSGTFNFSSGTSVTNTTNGACFDVWNSSPNVTYNGSLTQSGTSSRALVKLEDVTGGAITFQNGTLSSTSSAGTGILLSNADGTVNFNGTTTLNGGNAGIDIINGSAGTFTFGSGTTITSPTGTAFDMDGTAAVNTAAITYNGTITQASNAGLVNVKNHSTGTVSFSSGLSATNGTGIVFDNADGTYSFSGATTLNGGDAGIDILNGSGGTFSFNNNTTITSPTGTAFHVNASSPAVTYSGNITQNSPGQRVVNIDGSISNTITFNTGTIIGGASSTGVNINNANGNVTFSNGLNLGTSGSRMTNQAIAITGGTGTYSLGALSVFANGAQGLTAINTDGTLNASGSIDVTNATAIDIDGPVGFVTLGMNLTKVNSVGGTANGISIQDANGSFAIIGDGSNSIKGGNNSGGVISNKLGNDGVATSGIGIYLSNVSGVTLRRITINGVNQNYGIRGTNISNFVMEYSTVSGANGNSSASREGSIILNNVFGTNSINESIVSGGIEDNVRIENSTGTLTSFNITNCNILNNNTASGNIGFGIFSTLTANMTATVSACNFNGNRTISIRGDAAGNSTLNFIVSNNTITAGSAGNNQGNQGIEVSGSSAAIITYDIDNNKVGTVDGTSPSPLINTGINVFAGGSTCLMSGKVRNNKVINAGAGFSGFGIRVFSNGSASPGNTTIVANVSSNTVSNVGLDYGVLAEASGTSFSSTLKVALTGNNVSVLPGALDAIRVQARHTSTVCAKIAGNTTNSGGAGFYGIVVRQANTATFNLEGLASGSQTAATTKSYVASQNPSAASVDAIVATSFNGVAINSCNVQ